MRNFLLILSVLIPFSSCGLSYKEYSFNDIGLHIKIPNGYIVQDTFPIRNFVDTNGNQITEPAKIKELEVDLMKGLLLISSPDYNNTISFNIAAETEKTGNFDQYYAFSKDIQQLMAKQQMKEYDTSSSILTADNINIHKFLTYSTKTNPIQHSGIYIAKVKSYFLIIKTDYVDKTFGDVFEKAVLTSKFN